MAFYIEKSMLGCAYVNGCVCVGDFHVYVCSCCVEISYFHGGNISALFIYAYIKLTFDTVYPFQVTTPNSDTKSNSNVKLGERYVYVTVNSELVDV